ncbi:hypothetical protein [Paenibacillus sacheonensis]|nr:hypothetical protein [Paenibacillus sacheonensis]MBM7567137.1 hypothetical protein [Paenibacillus sacheonensis]
MRADEEAGKVGGRYVHIVLPSLREGSSRLDHAVEPFCISRGGQS